MVHRPSSAVWLTASVQVGFVGGGIASSLLTIGDRYRPHVVMCLSAFGASLTTACLALVADGLWPAIGLRLLTGVFLAGLYPIGMKVMASWASQRQRGLAFGLLIGALTVGSGMPHLISGLAEGLPWRYIMLIAAGVTALAGVLAGSWVRQGPYGGAGTTRPKMRYAWAGFNSRPPLVGQSRILRPHVGTLRILDMASDVPPDEQAGGRNRVQIPSTSAPRSLSPSGSPDSLAVCSAAGSPTGGEGALRQSRLWSSAASAASPRR
jgi:MFS family permease